MLKMCLDHFVSAESDLIKIKMQIFKHLVMFLHYMISKIYVYNFSKKWLEVGFIKIIGMIFFLNQTIFRP